MNISDNEQMIHMNLRIPKKLKEDIDRLSMQDRRFFSDYIRIVLEDHIKHKNEYTNT